MTSKLILTALVCAAANLAGYSAINADEHRPAGEDAGRESDSGTNPG